MPDGKLLAIYLNDHLAGATAAVEVVKRCLRNNESGPLGDFLRGLAAELEEDRSALQRVMSSVGAKESRAKVVAAKAAERAGRLKLNGRVRGYSPLSRLLELEGLLIGVGGKLALWRALQRLELSVPVDLAELIERAERHREGLEQHRLEAARRALGST